MREISFHLEQPLDSKKISFMRNILHTSKRLNFHGYPICGIHIAAAEFGIRKESKQWKNLHRCRRRAMTNSMARDGMKVMAP